MFADEEAKEIGLGGASRVAGQSTDAAGFRYVGSPTVEREAILRQYEAQAAGYDKSMHEWGFLTPVQSVEVLRQWVQSADAKILEAGCGTGLSDQEHYNAGYHNLHGFDLSPDMLQQAAAKNIHRSLTEGNMLERLPYRDDDFDAVVCVAAFTHILDAEPALREFVRVTKPGGMVIFSQRKDLFEERQMQNLLDTLEREGLVRVAGRSEWLPYVVNHEAYVRAGITVGYWVLEVQA